MTIAKKKYVDPNLRKIRNALDDIKRQYKDTEGESKINEALSGLYTAKSTMFKLKSTLNVLAEETSVQVDYVLSAIKKFSKPSKKRMKETFFKIIVKRMSTMLNKSEIELKNALDDYDEAEKSLNIVHDQVNIYITDLNSFINNENGKLTKRIKKLRTEAYAGSLACIVFWLSCPFVYGFVALGVEITLNNAKNELRKQRDSAKMSAKIVKGVIDEIENGHQFIHTEQPLIKTWAYKVEGVKKELEDVDMVVFLAINDETEDLKNMLNDLKEACKDYLKHSEDNLLIDQAKK